MKRKVSLALLFSGCLFFSAGSICRAAFARADFGTRAVSMGEAFTAVADDYSAMWWNPAGLYRLTFPQLAMTGYSPYGMPIPTTFWAGVLPLSHGALGFDAAVRDFQEAAGFPFAEKAFGVSYGASADVRLGGRKQTILYGGRLSYYRFHLAAAEMQSEIRGVDLDFGAQVPLTPQLTLGIAARSLASFHKGDKNQYDWEASAWFASNLTERLPRELSIGLSYAPDETTLVAFDLSKTDGMRQTYHLGLERIVADSLALRAGCNNGQFSFGLGYLLRNWQLDFSYAFHELQGTNQLTLSYVF